MSTTTQTNTRGAVSGAAVLDAVADAALDERRAAARKLAAALTWALAHPGMPDECASWEQRKLLIGAMRPENGMEYLGGPGTPAVAAFAVEQLATRLQVSTLSATCLVADAVNLSHRHPVLWARVQRLECPAWIATNIARDCSGLPAEGAMWVDSVIGHLTGTCSARLVASKIAYAVAKWCPEQAKKDEDQARDNRKVTIHLPDASKAHDSAAVADLVGRLSTTTDAIKFEALVAAKATELAHAGDNSSLDVRRSKALGLIADQLMSGELDLDTCDTGAANICHAGAEGQAEGPTDVGSADEQATGPTRPMPWLPVRKAACTVLYLHLSLAELATALRAATEGDAEVGPVVGWAEKFGPLTAEVVKDWLGQTNARIRPVLDLNRTDAVDQHDPPDWMRELVILRDGHCVFPWCGTNARACDLDHITEYVPADEGGPPGQTSPLNLAPLCRRHHRCKTFTRWRYTRLRDGTYLWTEPDGNRYRVDPPPAPPHSTTDPAA